MKFKNQYTKRAKPIFAVADGDQWQAIKNALLSDGKFRILQVGKDGEQITLTLEPLEVEE